MGLVKMETPHSKPTLEKTYRKEQHGGTVMDSINVPVSKGEGYFAVGAEKYQQCIRKVNHCVR